MKLHSSLRSPEAKNVLLLLLFVLNSVASLKDADCKCHLKNKQRVPWQVSIECPTNEPKDRHLCSGVIINSNWILTTANCTMRLTNENCYVRVGLSNLNDYSNHLEISETYTHPTYNPSYGSRVHDVGLLKMKHEIEFDGYKVGPACFDFSGLKNFSNENFNVSAWNTRMGERGPADKISFKEFQTNSENDKTDQSPYILAHNVGVNRVVWGELGAPLMYSQQEQVIVGGLESRMDDELRFDSGTNKNWNFTKFVRLDSAGQFVQYFVKREYCSTFFKCLGGDGIFADPKNSSTFYICNDHLPIKESCPAGTEFNAKHVSCIATDD